MCCHLLMPQFQVNVDMIRQSKYSKQYGVPFYFIRMASLIYYLFCLFATSCHLPDLESMKKSDSILDTLLYQHLRHEKKDPKGQNQCPVVKGRMEPCLGVSTWGSPALG